MNSAVRYDPVQLAQRISGVTLWNSTEAILFLMLLVLHQNNMEKSCPRRLVGSLSRAPKLNFSCALVLTVPALTCINAHVAKQLIMVSGSRSVNYTWVLTFLVSLWAAANQLTGVTRNPCWFFL